jgi:flagellar hook-length control protein FliK
VPVRPATQHGIPAAQQPNVPVEALAEGGTAPSEAAPTARPAAEGEAWSQAERTGFTVDTAPERQRLAAEGRAEAPRTTPTEGAPADRLSPPGAEFAEVRAHAQDPGAPRPSARTTPTATIRDVARISPADLHAGQPQRLSVEVDPPELGRCELELSLQDGRVRATLIAERPETAVALRAVEGQVREQLAARELQVTQFDVRHSGQDGGATGGRQQPGARSDQPAQAAPRMPTAQRAPSDSVRSTPTSSTTVDLMA